MSVIKKDWPAIRIAQMFAIEAALTFLLLLLLAAVGVRAAPPPVDLVQYRFNHAIDFNGCVDDPANPNPATVRNLPITPHENFSAGTMILVFTIVDYRVSLGGCLSALANSVSSISDTGGSVYSRRWQTLPTIMTGTTEMEIWSTNSTGSLGATSLTVHFSTAHLHVDAVAREFSGVGSFDAILAGNYTEPSVAGGISPYAATWSKTSSVWDGYTVFNQATAGGCDGFEPDCAYPATHSSGEGPEFGGYNETHMTIPCTLPMTNAQPCSTNTNSQAKLGGGDSKNASFGTWSVAAYRITVNTVGSHTFYYKTDSPQASETAFIGVMLNTAIPIPPPPPTNPMDFALNVFWVFIWVAFLMAVVIGALAFKKRFGRDD